MKIQRVVCDYYNKTKEEQYATCDYILSVPIVDVASRYRLQVETAEVSLTTMPLDMDSKYEILFDMKTPLGEYKQGVNRFNSPKVIKSVHDFIKYLNHAFDMDDETSFGKFSVNDEGILTFTTTQEERDRWHSVEECTLDNALYKIISFISPNAIEADYNVSEGHYTMMDVNKGDIFTLTEPISQKEVTINHLAKFKSVRFRTNLPVRKTKTFKQSISTGEDVSILTSIKINSAVFNLMSQTNLIYIPSEIREIELVGDGDIRQFMIYIELYYADGSIHQHKLAPNEYFEISLNFKEYFNPLSVSSI